MCSFATRAAATQSTHPTVSSAAARNSIPRRCGRLVRGYRGFWGGPARSFDPRHASAGRPVLNLMPDFLREQRPAEPPRPMRARRLAGSEVKFMLPDDSQRRAPRDSVFLLAGLRFEGQQKEHVIKVRNVSSTGLMAESDIHVVPGATVAINLRNIGWISGSVSWAASKRFGVKLDSEIDPRRARSPI